MSIFSDTDNQEKFYRTPIFLDVYLRLVLKERTIHFYKG